MGIGNTSSAALLKHCLTAMTLMHCIGRGTGLNNDQLQNIITVLQRALNQHKDITEPLDVLVTLLNQFNSRVLLNLDLRLGKGFGIALTYPLLQSNDHLTF